MEWPETVLVDHARQILRAKKMRRLDEQLIRTRLGAHRRNVFHNDMKLAATYAPDQ